MPSLLAALAAVVAALGGAAAAAAAAAIPPTPGDVSFFKEGHAYVLRSNDSFPLYVYDKDVAGRSNCVGSCAGAWPPLIASAGARAVGEWTLIKRGDGKLQWAWRGRPIYTHAGDSPEKPTGADVGGVWHLLPPFPN